MDYKLFLLIFIGFSVSVSVWVPLDSPCLCQEFRCTNGTSCLHASRVCNGYKDCPNGEDEPSNCRLIKRDHNCSKTEEFRCKFGGCIKIKQVCDSHIDCFGAVDEATDFCNWVHDIQPNKQP